MKESAVFKVGDVVICVEECSNIVMDGVYEIDKIHAGPDKLVKPYTTCRLKNVDGAYWLKRFKLANEQPVKMTTEPVKPATTESSPQGKTTIEVGDEIVVTYNQGIYKVVDYHAIVTAVLDWGSCKFAAPSKEQGGTGLSQEWTLGKPHIKLFKKKAKKLEIGDEVLIVKGYISDNPTSAMAMQDVGQIGPITDMRKSYSSNFNFPCIRVKSYWYAVDAVVPYINGMDIAKAILDAGSTPPIPEKPRKIINPRKGG